MNSITSTTKKVASNTLYQLVGKVVSMSITILATIIITRMYGRAGYGDFNLMQTIPGLFFLVVDFGFNAIATRELSKDFSKAEQYLGTILVTRLAMSLILMLVVALSLYFFPYSPSLKFGIYLSLFLILTQALYATTNIVFQVKLKYNYSTIGYIVGSTVILGFVLLLSYLQVNIAWVNFSYVIGGLVTFVINVYFLGRYINLRLSLKFDKQLYKLLLVQSLPLGLMFAFSQINFKADSIILSVLDVPQAIELSKIEAVAIYGLPYKIFEVALVVPTFFMNATYPVFVRHMLEGQEKLKQSFYKAIMFLFLFGVLATILGIVFAPFAISFLGGSEFTQSIAVLRLLVVGLPVFYVTQVLSWLIVTLGNQKALPAVYFVSAIFSLVTNIIIIPIYSFYGSAVITWLSELIILILLILLARRSWKLHYA